MKKNLAYAMLGYPIPLGRQGENNARRIVFVIERWKELYGDGGTVRLLHKRPKDGAPYQVPIIVSESGKEVYWDVTSFDTDEATQYGRAELQYLLSDATVKSELYYTEVTPSIDGAFTESYPGIVPSQTQGSGFTPTYVDSLPPTGEAGLVYFVPADALAVSETNKYDEFVWLEEKGEYEQLGAGLLTTEFDSFNARMNTLLYNTQYANSYGYVLLLQTKFISRLWVTDSAYFGTVIKLTVITHDGEQTHEDTYNVPVNANGICDGYPTTLSENGFTMVFAEPYNAIRVGNELAHEPIALRVDYLRTNTFFSETTILDWLDLVGLERVMAVVTPLPSSISNYDRFYIRRYTDVEGIWSAIGSTDGYYYIRITEIPENDYVYQESFVRKSMSP